MLFNIFPHLLCKLMINCYHYCYNRHVYVHIIQQNLWSAILIPPKEVYCCMVYLPCLPSFLSLSGTPPGAPLPPPDPQEFSSGDYVRVELDQDVLRLMQEGHGGWNVDMAKVSVI